MRIAVDAFGGDHAPLEIIKGSAQAVKELGVEIILVGDEETVKKTIAENGISDAGFSFVHAEQTITMEDDPMSVIRAKKNSSMSLAMKLVKNGEAEAMVSAGNSGALLIGATMIVKRIKGISRAALAPVMPTDTGTVMLIDSGANIECTPEYLEQFGIMGSIYMKEMFHLDAPRVGLLNNGTEECKGPELQKAAYGLLKENKTIHFIGNVEARGLALGDCDVAVADGFTGNIALKMYEGVGKMLAKNISDLFKKSISGIIGALFVYKNLSKFKKKVDYKEHGGAPLLGVQAPVIKAHGSSDARAFKNAIRQAVHFYESGIIDKITENLAKNAE